MNTPTGDSHTIHWSEVTQIIRMKSCYEKQKAVSNCVWMLVVKIEGIERILLENRFAKETTCLPFSMSDFPQFMTTFICCVKQMKQELIS